MRSVELILFFVSRFRLQGVDADGKLYALKQLAGKVVLVVRVLRVEHISLTPRVESACVSTP